MPVRYATNKGGGSSKNGRDSHGQRRGFKKFQGFHLFLTTQLNYVTYRIFWFDSVEQSSWQEEMFILSHYLGRCSKRSFSIRSSSRKS